MTGRSTGASCPAGPAAERSGAGTGIERGDPPHRVATGARDTPPGTIVRPTSLPRPIPWSARAPTADPVAPARAPGGGPVRDPGAGARGGRRGHGGAGAAAGRVRGRAVAA